MADWSTKTDKEVFSSEGEQIGSQVSYWRDLEIRRRHFQLEKQTSESTISAAQAQERAADATIATAKWTMISAVAVAVTVVITGASLVLQAFTAINSVPGN